MKTSLVSAASLIWLATTSAVFAGSEGDAPPPADAPESAAPMHGHPMPPAYGSYAPYGYAVAPGIHLEKGMYEAGYLLRVYTQGISPEDIEIQVDGRRLRLSTEVSRQGEWQSEEPYQRSSLSSRGALRRSISLPRDADASKLTTSVEQGVLEIRIPWYQ